MNKTTKTVLIILGIILLIYIFKRSQNKADKETSDFLGIFKRKGSQSWANDLAARYCKLQKMRPQGFAGQQEIQRQMADIISALAKYGYDLIECTAVKRGARRYITQAEADCRNNSGSWVYDPSTQTWGCKGAGIR